MSCEDDYLSYVFPDIKYHNNICLHASEKKRERLRIGFSILGSKIDKLYIQEDHLSCIQDDIDFSLLIIDLSDAKTSKDYDCIASDVVRGMYTLISSPSSSLFESTSSDDKTSVVREISDKYKSGSLPLSEGDNEWLDK